MPSVLKTGVRFECQPACSACCRISGCYVYLTEEEARKIARFLQISHEESLNTFTREIDHKLALYDGEDESCVFLEDHQCLIYEVRPRQYRTFPFLAGKFTRRTKLGSHKKICPGIGRGRCFYPQEIKVLLNSQS